MRHIISTVLLIACAGCTPFVPHSAIVRPDLARTRTAYLRTPIQMVVAGSGSVDEPIVPAQTEQRIRNFLVNELGWVLSAAPEDSDVSISAQLVHYAASHGGGVEAMVWVEAPGRTPLIGKLFRPCLDRGHCRADNMLPDILRNLLVLAPAPPR